MASETRTVVITQLREITGGQGPHGEWHLHRVTATTTDGEEIPAQLRTFQGDLPQGVPIEVVVDRHHDDRYGTTWTLRRPRGSTRQVQELLQAHAEMIASAVRRIDRLEHKVFLGVDAD